MAMKFVVGGRGTGVEAATIELGFGESVAAVFHAAMPTNNTMMPTIRRQGARVAGAACAALMTVFFFLTCYAFNRPKAQCSARTSAVETDFPGPRTSW